MAVVDDGVGRLVESLSGAKVGGLPLAQRVETVVDIAWNCYRSPTSLAAFEILRATRDSLGDSSRRHLLDINDAIIEVIWAALRGMVLIEMIMNEPLDWQRERAALVEMATRRLEQGSTGRSPKPPAAQGDPAPLAWPH